MFVHRNIANLAPADDPNFLATLQYAVQVLKVRHVLVVGHYGCGGVKAALANAKLGQIDRWLAPLHDVAREHAAELGALPDDAARWDPPVRAERAAPGGERRRQPFRARGVGGRAKLAVHGWCYALATGMIKDMGATIDCAPSPARGER